ncbi:hypothetical protein M2146_001099 [Lachnospiraceae bacterium PF1-22]
MKLKEFADLITGKEYGYKMFSDEELEIATNNGFVIVTGASDDLMEFEGAIYDEADCFDGGRVYITSDGISNEKAECYIDALWCEEGDYSWTYETAIPHETFEVLEGDKPFCRGIVFDIRDVI